MSRKVIPLGDRFLVKRRRVGEKIGSAGIIYTTETTADRPTDLADVLYTPEMTFGDKELIENADEIIKKQIEYAKNGDAQALDAVQKFNQFLKLKSIKEGDLVMISKYSGIDFHTSDSDQGYLTLVRGDDIMAVIVQEGVVRGEHLEAFAR